MSARRRPSAECAVARASRRRSLYDRSFSFGRFSRDFPQYRDHIVRLLIGDVFNDEVGEVFTVMRNTSGSRAR